MTEDNNGTDTYNKSMPHVTGLAPSGYIYIPSACRPLNTTQGYGSNKNGIKTKQKCRLHFSFHGCGVDEYYNEAVHHLGFQEWGEANNIVIVYPRMQPHGYTIETQSGCWDGYAQTGPDYALQSGAQMHAVRLMIAAVGGPQVWPYHVVIQAWKEAIDKCINCYLF